MEHTARLLYRPSFRRPPNVILAWLALAGLAAAAAPAIEVESINSRTQRLLDQADALIADGQWVDAIDTLDIVAEEGAGRLASAGAGRYVGVRAVCNARLSRLPREALELLRTRIDPDAAALLQQAREGRDRQLLQRGINEYFVSSSTPDALLLLADLSLERGDFAEARRALQRLHPMLVGPTGRPIGVDLIGIDTAARWASLEPILRGSRNLLPPVFPDADARLAEGLMRLAITSIRERDFDRAACEISLLDELAPDSIAKVAGADTPITLALSAMLTEAKNWPVPDLPDAGEQLAGAASRAGEARAVGSIVGPIWPAPVAITPRPKPAPTRRTIRPNIIINGRPLAINQPRQLPQEVLPGAYPCVYGPWLLYRDRSTLLARDLLTGKPAVVEDGKLHAGVVKAGGRNHRNAIRIRQLQQWGLFVQGGAARVAKSPWGPPQVLDGVLYARVDSDQDRSTTKADSQVIGISLLRDGLKVVEFQAPKPPWSFSGPPLVVDGLAYVVLMADEIRPRVAVACYSPSTGEQVWLTSVCTGPPADDSGHPPPPVVLAKQGDTLLVNTNFGAIAAVDSTDGHVNWVTEYPRKQDEQTAYANPTILPAESQDWPDVSPCVCHRGRVMASPTDSSHTFALDISSGQVLWSTQRPGPAAGLLGARGSVLVCGGRVLTLLDINTGAVKSQWPGSERSGIRGRGRGCLAGEEVFWPTRESIYVMNARTGQMTRPPIDLTPVGADGANLTPAHGMLVAAGAEKLIVYGPYSATPLSIPGDALSERARSGNRAGHGLTRNQ